MARTRPGIRVHLSIADHDKTSEVWANLETRGMLVELWRKAGEKFAGKRDDKVPLKPTDRMDITCSTDLETADRMLRELCVTLRYSIRTYPNRWVVTIRNFTRKQGYQPQELDTVPRSPVDKNSTPPSPSPIPSPKSESKEEKSGATAPDSSPAARARSVWPRLIERAKQHGARWAPKPGPGQVKIMAARIADGATEEDLERAVEGYIRKNGTEERDGFDPMKHFTATTIFRPRTFDANVQGSYLSDPKRPKPSRHKDANEVIAEARRKSAEDDERLGGSTEDPTAIGDLIGMSLRQNGGQG